MRAYRVSALPDVLERPAIYLVRIPGAPETFQMYVVGRDGVARAPAAAQGADGASAYQIAVAAGFVGTEAAWLASLQGPPGDDGADGSDGDDGAPGASAYQIAVAAGFVGTEAVWLASLQGPPGDDGTDGSDGDDGAPGASAYQIAVAAGFVGTEAAWLASLQGPPGDDGTDGSDGDDGAPGASAYQIAVSAGFVGTEAAWLASLQGPPGDDGADGVTEPLILTEVATGPALAGTVRLFRRPIAGRQMLGMIGPSGLDSALQPFIARNKVGIWVPPGNANTVPGIFGLPAATAAGTATARNVAATNLFTRMRRLGYLSAATAAALAGMRFGSLQYTLGDGTGLGGFMLVVRCGVAAFTADARCFVGMRNSSAAPTNVEPSTITQCIGMGFGAADTTLRLYSGGTAAQAPIDLGANFPAKTANVDMYELALFAPPGAAQTCHWQVSRLNTGDVAEGTLNGGAAVLPSAATFLTFNSFITNNATAAAVGLDFGSVYIEQDF